ncbi:hypothetical protein [Streptomyces sp. NPDC020747]|uniref:hypothetical protein n=1 Tax=Streptomyces sp. NPDC020747 TaxID=3365086 RepID=UPI0037A83932
MAHQGQSSGGPGNEGDEQFHFRQELTKARDAVRREIIEWWTSTHPEEAEPETSREVLLSWLKEHNEKIKELPEKRIQKLRDGAEKCGGRVLLLDGIEHEDIPVVEDAICSAYWTGNARASWSIVLADFTDEHPSLFGALSFLSFIVSFWLVVLLLVRKEDFANFPGQGGIAIGVLMVAFLFIHGRILAVLGLMSSKLLSLWRLIAASSAIYLVVQDGWQAGVVEWVSKKKEYVPDFFHIAIKYVDVCVLYALKGFAALVLIGMTLSFLDDVRYKVGPKEPDGAVTSARILLDLLDLAFLSQEALKQGSVQSDGLRTYLTSSVRVDILLHLEKVAQAAEGRWKRSLRVGDEISDRAIYEIGDGIAAAARKWKVAAATGGDKLVDMNNAFVNALVDAAKGNWELLATETSERELLRRKLFRMARRVLALATMGGTAYVVLFDPFSWFGASFSPAVSSFMLMFAAILSVSIDPAIVERIGSASKISGAFTDKK